MNADTGATATPPEALDAEISVLGAVLQGPGALRTAIEVLRPADFSRDAHRKIFAACLDLSERDEEVNLVTLITELTRREQLEEAGGVGALCALVGAVPTSANVASHVRIVKEQAELRRLRDIATQTVEKSKGDGADPRSAPGTASIPALHPAHLEYLRARGITDPTIVAAGIYSARPQDLVRLAGRPVPDGTSGLVFPYPGCDGYSVLRPFPPLVGKDGDSIKFLSPPGPPRLYVPRALKRFSPIRPGASSSQRGSRARLSCGRSVCWRSR